MRDPDTFDDFYRASRRRLLLQAFALTGDLRASRSAVRDAFVIAGHHWRKVSRHADPEAWLRPVVWAHAHRRHTARMWHRDKSLDPDVTATLDALGKLTGRQRRLLILNQLASGTIEDFARELGITQATAEREVQTATAQFAINREVRSTQIRQALLDLDRVLGDAAFTRSSAIRRASTARRRLYTGAGAVVTVAALVVAGSFVTDDRGVSPSLAGEQIASKPSPLSESVPSAPSAGQAPDEPAGPALDVDDLLTPQQLETLAPRQRWGVSSTTDNTEGTGIHVPCQQARFADPDGLGAFVRRQETTTTEVAGQPKAPVTAVQATELSRTAESAHTAYTTALGWYAGCTDRRVQLLSAKSVRGVGDEAMLLSLRSWEKPVSTFTVAVARTGQITTATVGVVEAALEPQVKAATSLLSAAVDRLCGSPGAGTCAGRAQLADAVPPPVGKHPGLLSVVDLPAAEGAAKPWAAAPASKAVQNPASWRCDKADFNQKGMTSNVTQTFVIVGEKNFGLVETAAALPAPGNARGFVNEIRSRLDRCEEDDPATEVVQLSNFAGENTDIAVWQLTTEIGDNRALEFYMAFVRNQNAVAQLTVNLDPGAQIDQAAFLSLVQRARARLTYLPGPT